MVSSTSWDMTISGLSRLFRIMSWTMMLSRSFTEFPDQHLRIPSGDVMLGDDPSRMASVDVVVDIGDLIRKADDLSLQGGWFPAVRWFRMPSRTSFVRFSPLPFFSTTSTTRTLCL